MKPAVHKFNELAALKRELAERDAADRQRYAERERRRHLIAGGLLGVIYVAVGIQLRETWRLTSQIVRGW